MADQSCLHCAIRNAILDHFAELGHLHGDVVIVDSKEVLDALVQLIAETLAAVDDVETRSKGFARLLNQVIEGVNDIRAAGEQAETFRPS